MRTFCSKRVKKQRFLPAILAACFCISCGGGGGQGNSLQGNPSPGPAEQTAQQNPACQLIRPFYFEIGDAGGVITNASVGTLAPTANTLMDIASGTKWLFGAYVVQLRSSALADTDLLAAHMMTGYVSMDPACDPLATVMSCFDAGNNGTFTASSLNRFHYRSSHFQKWGVDNGLAAMGNSELAAEFRSQIGFDIPLTFSSPTLAGGAFMSASQYAVFLRKILNGDLAIAALLGTSPICTLPSVCPSADASPIERNWHYSLGHWVEDDATGDGSFSSPGAFGFYPWIDSSKTHYGILARRSIRDNPVATSIACGALIRRAFVTGVVQ